LEVLFLQGNLISDFPVWQLAANPYLVTIRLAENLWSCDCDFLHPFRHWLHGATSAKVNDAEQLSCTSNEADGADEGPRPLPAAISSCPEPPPPASPVLAALIPLPARTHLQQDGQEQEGEEQEKAIATYLPLMIAVLASFSAIVLLAFVAVCFRHSIRLWWRRSRYGGDTGDSRVLDSPSPSSSPSSSSQADDMGCGKLFDAYVAYSVADAGLVNQILWRELEQAAAAGSGHRFRLCLHHRDLPPTTSGEAVLKVAEASRTIVIALSHHFLATEWTRPDFRAGLMAALADGRRPVIFLLLPSSPLAAGDQQLEPSLRLLLHTSLVLSWSEPACLQHLEQALLYAGASSRGSPFPLETSGGGRPYYGEVTPYQMQAQPAVQQQHYYGSHHFQTIYSEVPEKMNISHI